MKRNIMAALLATAFISVSCGGSQQTESQTLAFDSVKYENTANNIEVTIKVDYPTTGDSVVVNAIREYVSETLGGTYAGSLALSDSMINHYGKAQADSMVQWLDNRSDEGSTLLCSFEIKKAYECDSYVTLTTYNETYTGGAHGNYTATGVTFRKNDGRRFGYDMLCNTYSDGFHKLVKEGLREYFKQFEQPAETDQQLKELLLVDDDVNYLPLPDSQPYLTADGVVFTYQPYEIAPYAAGTPQFTVPFAKMRPYMTATAMNLTNNNKETK